MNSEQNVAILVSRLGISGQISGQVASQIERPARASASMVLGSSIIMLLGTGLVSAVNFGYQVSMARWLGPAAFGNVSVVATMLMLASAITLSFQLVCTKFVARNQSQEGRLKVYHKLIRQAWRVGILVGMALILASGYLSSLLRLNSRWLIVLLAVAIAFSVPTGVKRGGLQGLCNFHALNGNFVLEAAVKLVAAVALVSLGYGVLGAVGAMTASVVAAYVCVSVSFPPSRETSICAPASFREGIQAIVFFIGQVLINNIDIVLVKLLFNAEDAGLYAAVALFGRLLYYSAWSVVSAMFPISAGAQPHEKTRSVLLTPLLMVGSMSGAFILLLTVLPRFMVALVFGAGFARAGSLLSLYATATGLYSLSVVLMTYEMSRKIANTGWFQLLIGGLLVVAIGAFHHSLREVILVQIVLMVVLLVGVSLPFLQKLAQPPLRTKEA